MVRRLRITVTLSHTIYSFMASWCLVMLHESSHNYLPLPSAPWVAHQQNQHLSSKWCHRQPIMSQTGIYCMSALQIHKKIKKVFKTCACTRPSTVADECFPGCIAHGQSQRPWNKLLVNLRWTQIIITIFYQRVGRKTIKIGSLRPGLPTLVWIPCQQNTNKPHPKKADLLNSPQARSASHRSHQCQGTLRNHVRLPSRNRPWNQVEPPKNLSPIFFESFWNHQAVRCVEFPRSSTFNLRVLCNVQTMLALTSSGAKGA